jgi:hypothetical protein
MTRPRTTPPNLGDFALPVVRVGQEPQAECQLTLVAGGIGDSHRLLAQGGGDGLLGAVQRQMAQLELSSDGSFVTRAAATACSRRCRPSSGSPYMYSK